MTQYIENDIALFSVDLPEASLVSVVHKNNERNNLFYFFFCFISYTSREYNESTFIVRTAIQVVFQMNVFGISISAYFNAKTFNALIQ